MLNGIKFVVKTTSNEERAELKELIFKDKLAASAMDDSDQVRYIAIYTGEVWFLSMIDEKHLKSLKCKYFSTLKEFREFYQTHDL